MCFFLFTSHETQKKLSQKIFISVILVIPLIYCLEKEYIQYLQLTNSSHTVLIPVMHMVQNETDKALISKIWKQYIQLNIEKQKQPHQTIGRRPK